MSGAKFTAGPWWVSKDDGGRFTVKGSGSIHLASIWFPPSGDAEANAHLIAASPDLLAFAAAYDAFMTARFPGGPDSVEGVRGAGVLSDQAISLWRDARAAISKAQGQSKASPSLTSGGE